jgi:hypothetical protein
MATSLAFRSAENGVNSPPNQLTSLHGRYLLDEARAILIQPPKIGPDISYIPDLFKYQERASASIRKGNLVKEVPTGWPSFLDSPLAWTGDDFGNEESFVHHLSNQEKTEIRNALDHFNGKAVNLEQFQETNFL